MHFWTTLVAHQATWFTAVIAAGTGLTWPGVVAVALFCAWRLAVSHHVRLEIRLGVLALGIGLLLESLWTGSGLLAYSTSGPTGGVPAWILALWVGFALTVVPLLGMLHARPVMAALFGALGGPLAYWGAGQGWGSVQFAEPHALSLLAVAAGWAAAMPMLTMIAHRGLRDRRAVLQTSQRA